MNIAIRYLDANGGLVYEEITGNQWSVENAERERKKILTVGPPPFKEISQAEIVPLLLWEGDELTVAELIEGDQAMKQEAARLAQDPTLTPIVVPIED